jgi:hypothetical protein
MDEPRIRAATAADVLAIADVVDQAYRHYIARIGKPPGPMLDDYGARVLEGVVWVIEDGAAVAGIIVLLPAPDLSAPRQYRHLSRSPGLRVWPAAARIRGGRGIAARLPGNPALHASNDGGESAPLRFNRL